MKILNLYAGIGGNRKFWDGHDITAVEYNEDIAEAYKDRYPTDTVIVGDAKEYLLKHYKKFDFIWVSPPCQSHSRIRKCKVDCAENKMGKTAAILPDMSLWQIIIFLQSHVSKGKWVVENVKPYYEPLIKSYKELDRHLYWSNFYIAKMAFVKDKIIEQTNIATLKDFDISKYKIKNKQQVIRNQVNYEIGKYILDCAMEKSTYTQKTLFDEENVSCMCK